MEILSKNEFLTRCGAAFRKIFEGFFPSNDHIFSTLLVERFILFRYDYELTNPLLEDMIYTAQKVGDTGFYIAVLTGPDYESRLTPLYWFLEFSDIDKYVGLVGPLEHVIFSPSSQWGIKFSFDGYALLGCTEEFAIILRERFPGIDTQVYDFLNYWKESEKLNYIRTTWIPPLLTHIYGENRCRELMKKIGSDFNQTGNESENHINC